MKGQDIFGLRDAVQNQITTEDEKRADFFRKNFNLKLNPFPEVGVPESEVSNMAPIRTSEFQIVGDWLRSALRDRKLKVLFIKGDYGSGKSFLLRRIVSIVSEAFTGLGEQKAKIVYVYRPSFEAQALNRAILEEIGLDNIRKMTWVIIGRELAADLKKTPYPVGLQKLMENLVSSSRKPLPSNTLFPLSEMPALKRLFDLNENDDYRKFLHQFDELKRNRKELRSYFIDLFSRGLSNMASDSSSSAFVDLLLSYEDAEAWKTLLNIQSPRRDRANFVRQFLQDLIKLLKSDGYVYLFVVIDEFEQITESGLLSTKEQAEYAYTMMEIINQIDTGLGLIISVTPDAFNRLANIVVPFTDRVLAQIDLAPLSPDEIAVLVSYYLEQARAEDSKQPSGIFPFSPEAIKVAAEKLGPIGLGTTPRNVVQFFHNLLEHCFYNEISEINEQVVNDFVQHFRTRKSFAQNAETY